MKKHFNFKSMYRTALLALCLLTVGVGNAWADMYLAGTMNDWAQTDATKFVDNKIEVTLDAETTYEFKIVDGDKWRSCDASITNTTLNYELDKENVSGYNISITTGEAGTYIFQYSWYDSKHHFSVYYPQSRLKKNTVLYFDGRNSTKGWGTYTWGARFFYKYYDSGGDHSNLDCTSAVEDYVHYTTVPNHDYLGQIQVERKDPSNMDGERWNYTGVCCAYSRANSGQNCMAISNDNKDWDNTFIPVWTTYCPPISSVTMTDNGSTLYGGNGSAGTPYLIEAGDPIKVHVTEAVSAVNDGNMTVNYQFKDGASNIGDEGTGTSASKTSGSSGTTHTIIVEARNKYNGAAGTLARCTLYYETKTVYTGLSVAKSGDDSKASAPTISQTWAIATNSVTVTATVPDGYYFTGWTSSNGSFGDATALSTTFTPTADNAVATATYALRWAIATSYDSWNTSSHIVGNISTSAGLTSGYVDITLPANTRYELKLYDKAGIDRWLGHTTDGVTLNYSNSGTKYAMAEDNYNLGFTTAGAGTYRFTWDITNSKVSVTYPTSYQVTAAVSPAGTGTATPSSATYMSTTVGGEITATPNYSHYFNGWTSSAGGTFTSASSATTTFKPASAAATVTAAFAERTAFIEGNFQVYNSSRGTRTKTGDSWQDASTAIKMTYDSENNRYYLHTYSTPAELAEQLNSANAYFYVKTSTSGSSIADAATYKAYSSSSQSLSEYGYSHALVTVSSSEHGFKFTGSEDGYVILYFNGTHVWYELECALSYYGGDGATGDAPAARTYYAYGSNQTAAANTYSKTGYNFANWNTASGGGGTTYAAGATNVAMNAREVCLHAQWTAKEYTINLANMDATTPGDASVTVTFDASTNMTSPINRPAKTHYDFAGYWTSRNTGTTLDTLVIDANGNWIKDVQYFTGHSGDNPTWIHDYAITLYAKWTEHEYDITIEVTGSGSTSPASSTTAKYVTASGDITAIPGSGYSFTEWGFSKQGESDYDVYVSDGSTYNSTSNPIKIKAQRDGTLTANFTANDYTVTLENLGADEAGTENVSVTYDATTGLTSAITKPEKAHYDFGGYYISTNKGSTLTTQLIDADGNWIKDVSGYTGHSGDNPTWVCAGDTTLYAKWTETAYTITPSVTPAGAGSVNTVTDAHLITPSSTITATPANAAWIFDYWEYGTHVGKAGGDGNAITVTSDMNSTITAHFKPRYELVGSYWESDDERGMPGWSYDGTGVFTFNSFTALGTGDGKGCDLSCSRTLEANTTYKFQIHDRVTGNHGYATEATYIGDGDHLLFNTKDQNVMLAATGAGTYTFRITNITEDEGKYYPTVTVERPHQVYFGSGYAGIDDLSSVTSGTTGGTLAVTTSAGSLSNEDWVDYGTNVTYTPSAETGYTFEGFYTSDGYSSRFTQDNPWIHYNVTGDDHVYAKFEEISTTVTLANDGNGHVEIDDSEEDETTCGVTTTRELTAVPNEGYMFDNWTTSSSPDFEVDDAEAATVTLTGHGAGTAGTLTANFTECWVLSAQTEGWGSATFTISNIADVSGDAVGFVDISLPANTNLQFKMVDNSTGTSYMNGTDKVYYMTYTNYTNWDFTTGKTYNCGITTAGKGTYRFTWNITDKTMTVTYPLSYQVNYDASPSVGGSVTVIDDDSQSVPSGGYVRNGGSVTYTAAANTGFTFEGWYTDDTYGTQFSTESSWTDGTVTKTSNSYAKFDASALTFTGGAGGTGIYWNDASNWSPACVPTIYHDVTVPKYCEVGKYGSPVVATAKNIVIDTVGHSSARLLVNAGYALAVEEMIKVKTSNTPTYGPTTENLLKLESDASYKHGALAVKGYNDEQMDIVARVEFHTQSCVHNFASLGGEYAGFYVNQFIGTPLRNPDLWDYYGCWIYKWDPTHHDEINDKYGDWVYQSSSTPLEPFRGYDILSEIEYPETYWLEGQLVYAQDTTLDLYYNAKHVTDMGAELGQENMFANSWTAPIDVSQMTTSDFAGGDEDKMEATIYVFNSGWPKAWEELKDKIGTLPGQYLSMSVKSAEYTSSITCIPAMQAFSVFAKTAGASLTLDYDRIVYNPLLERSTAIEPMRAPRRARTELSNDDPEIMRIRVEGAQGADQMHLLLREDFHADFDNGWDARKMFGESYAPQIFAITEDGNMSVNCIPDAEGTVLGFRKGSDDSEYTFRFEYDGEETLYLNDLVAQTSTLIDAENTYTFTAAENDIETRFVISASPIHNAPTGLDHIGNSASKVHKLMINGVLYIIRGGRIYNASGMIIK